MFINACIGGRIGYILLYNLPYFSQNILYIFYVWRGGMSFHGGLIGVIVSILYFSFKYQINIFKISDFIVPLVPFSLGIGRLGNFINSELCGRVAINCPYAILFPNTYESDLKIISKNPQLQFIIDQYGVLPRHPSQLYECILEGIVLFFIIYIFSRKKRPMGSISGVFLLSYGILRIFGEFFREPDIQIGFIKNIITMGQILSIPMIFFGITIIVYSFCKK